MDGGLELLDRAKAKLALAAEYRRLAAQNQDPNVAAIHAALADAATEDYRWLCEMAVRILVEDRGGG